jgi:hypothetical protein
MKANEYGLKNLRRVMQNIEKWTAQPDGEYEHLNEIHRAARAQYQRYVNHVQRYLFGKYVNNAPGQKPNDIVPRELQKEALQWIDRNVMEAPMWLYPESIVTKLGVDYIDEIRARQQTVIALLLSSGAVMNLHSAQMQWPEAYPVEEYLNDVFAMIWKPLTAKDEQQNSFRRFQQRTYVDFIDTALNSNNSTAQRSDAILYFEQHLDKVESYLKAQQSSGINAQHYKNLLLRVKKMREKYESGK